MAEHREIKIGLLGFGTVGEGTFRMLQANRDEILSKTGATLTVTKIGVKNSEKPRTQPPDLFTTDLDSIVTDPQIDIVVEVIGGEEPARALIAKALQSGKHVVTANKELVAKHGSDLTTLAESKGLDFHFEAAVGGGIPVVQPLKHQLAANDVIKLMGILNGTSNHILTEMDQRGRPFNQALAEAQELGYAEADPTADIEGFDTMYKIAILAAITFGKQLDLAHIHREGMSGITAEDMAYAKDFGYRIKLLGICEEIEPGTLMVRVHPALVPQNHQLATVNGVYNALWLHGDFAGDLMFSGRGAGADPTASAVTGDILDVVRNLVAGRQGSAIPYGKGINCLPVSELETRYYIRFEVQDTPGTLGQIATALGKRKVGLAAMEMKTKVGGLGEIAFLTHVCKEADFTLALDETSRLECVTKLENWVRVES